tara:strand:- start:925 stop:1188 length:264 start_codon:yes stop_codon:yes gene_type:complete
VSTFFGLGPNYRPILHKQIFQLCYNSKGGFTFSDAYELPVYLRTYYFKLLNEQLTAEEEAAEKSRTSGGKSSGPPKVPTFARNARPK